MKRFLLSILVPTACLLAFAHTTLAAAPGAELDGFRWNFPSADPMPEKPRKGQVCKSGLVKGDPNKTDNFTKTCSFGGDKGKRYQVTLRFRGVVEPMTYQNGAKDGEYFYIGGTAPRNGYNIYKLDVSAPKSHYFLNRRDKVSHDIFTVDYTATILIDGGATLTMSGDGQNGKMIANWKKLTIPGVEEKPFNGQFLQVNVVDVQEYKAPSLDDVKALAGTGLRKGDRIVFLGDSITQAGARGNGYIRQIENVIKSVHPELGIAIIGAGISGHKVPDCQKRLQRDVISKNPTIVFIYIGINDVWHWNRNRGTKKEDFDAGLRDMIGKINAAGARVIMCTPTVIGEKIDGSNKYDSMLDEYSDISRKVAKDTGSQMLDLRKGFMDTLKAMNKDNKERGILTGDTVHLNGAGNAKVAELMLGALKVKMPKLKLPTIFTSHMVLQRDKPVNVWGHGDAGKDVSITLGTESTTAKVDAAGQWKVTLNPRDPSAKPVKLTVKSGEEQRVVEDILVGDVWVGSGQSNMEWRLSGTMHGKQTIAAANQPLIRLYHVPKVQTGAPASDINASWKVTTPKNVPNFSAVLYHFGEKLHKEIGIPLGLVNSSWGGSPIEPWTVTEKGSGKMYNGMIAPLRSFPIKGCIWYQGETNVMKKNGLKYFDKKKDLINGWRQFWGQDMPFYSVQIAPWSGRYEPGQLPALWEAQVATLKLPKTGLAVTTDLVDNIKDIHPRNKLDVGNRLALWALAKEYGKGIVYSGPLFKELKVEGNKARVVFAHAKGLKSRDGKPLSEFKVAGADAKFVEAKAEVDGDTVVVSAEGVTPTQVQFGWHKLANPNLVNGAGLPASPFQSNNWQGGTGE